VRNTTVQWGAVSNDGITCGWWQKRPVKILLISNDPSDRGELIDYMTHRNFKITCLSKPTDLCRHLFRNQPDFIILDLAHDNDGHLRLLSSIKSRSDIPVIAIIEHDADQFDRVTPLERGADDCLARPFFPQELVARIRAVLRRFPVKQAFQTTESGSYQFAGWQLNLHRRRLTNPNGATVTLSAGDYALLVAFLRSPQRTLTREFLVQATQATRFDRVRIIALRSIDVQVWRLRRKLAGAFIPRELIEAKAGIGYAFTASVTKVKAAAFAPAPIVAAC
jgi:DNA-binding response OmpR family regulator